MVGVCSVIVVVRVRPLNSREKSLKSGQCIDLQPDDSLTATESSGQARAFAFDAVFNPQTSQEEVYERTGALVLEKALQGYNVTMFAYGQTGERASSNTAELLYACIDTATVCAGLAT